MGAAAVSGAGFAGAAGGAGAAGAAGCAGAAGSAGLGAGLAAALGFTKQTKKELGFRSRAETASSSLRICGAELVGPDYWRHKGREAPGT